MGEPRGRRTYRALLLLFPPGFRARSGAEMERLFVELRTGWTREHRSAGVAFWLPLVADTVRGAVAEWAALLARTAVAARGAAGGETMGGWTADVRFAWRQIVRNPLYSGIILLLMGVGVAGNVAVFRVFNGLFLRPLPFAHADRLVDLDETAPEWNLEYVGVSYPDFVDWRASNRTFDAIAAYTEGGADFSSGGSAERITVVEATHDLDDALSLAPILGRFFTPGEDVRDGPRVALLTEGFWAERFARDPGVLGRTITLDGRPSEVVGVLPGAARFVSEAGVWVPLQEDEANGSGWYLTTIGRLAEGVTGEQALADLTAIHRAAIEEREENAITSPVLSSLRDRYLGDNRLGAAFLLGAVGVVLLIACANIAGLMFARSLAREGEMALRAALGAPRGRLVSQLLTESALLASLGAAAGALLGIQGSRVLVASVAERFPSWVTFDLDGRFLVFCLAITAGSALIFGLVPAVRTSRVGSGGRATASRGRRRGMGLLVVGEVALALVLLVVGGLASLDVWRLGRVDPGFRVEGVAAYTLSLPAARYPASPERLAFQESYLQRLRAAPEIQHAAVASNLPLSGHWGWFWVVEGEPPRPEGEPNPVVLTRAASPGYFEAMGIQILAGRGFDDFDGREEGSLAVVVNETFARSRMSGVEGAVGRRIAAGTEVGKDARWMTVVGVARDVLHYGVDTPMRPGVYQPWRQLPRATLQVALVHDGSAADALAAARRITAEVDPELALYDVRTMREAFDRSLWTRRATSWFIGTFSAVALLLAVAGLYGVISYSVGQRTREISVRMAVGARQDQVLSEVVRQGMKLVAAGVGVGLVVSAAAAGPVAGLLVQVRPRDPSVYAGVTALLVVVALLANWLPARRAARMDPMAALRRE